MGQQKEISEASDGGRDEKGEGFEGRGGGEIFRFFPTFHGESPIRRREGTENTEYSLKGVGPS